MNPSRKVCRPHNFAHVNYAYHVFEVVMDLCFFLERDIDICNSKTGNKNCVCTISFILTAACTTVQLMACAVLQSHIKERSGPLKGVL